MAHNDYIPSADAEFAAWVANFVDFTATRIGSWSIPETAFQPVSALAAAFAISYKLATDPATRTVSTIFVKTEQKKEFEKLVRPFVKSYIAFNPAVSDAERILAGLHIPKSTRTPVPVPTRQPNSLIDTAITLRLTVHFFDEDSKHPAKPEGVHGCEIRWAILEAPPTSVEDLIHSSFDTHTPVILNFDDAQRGKTIYMRLCWENTRGQKGPWSELKSSIIP